MKPVHRVLVFVILAASSVGATTGFSVADTQFSEKLARVVPTSAERPFPFEQEITMSEHLQ